jgi:hypothetical protein
MNFEDFEEQTDMRLLMENTAGEYIRAEWRARLNHLGINDRKGGIVFKHCGNPSVFDYILKHIKHQATDAGVLIDELLIGPSKSFPEGALAFKRDGAEFVNVTPNTGKCVEIF